MELGNFGDVFPVFFVRNSIGSKSEYSSQKSKEQTCARHVPNWVARVAYVCPVTYWPDLTNNTNSGNDTNP